jgi:hypothetical protein
MQYKIIWLQTGIKTKILEELNKYLDEGWVIEREIHFEDNLILILRKSINTFLS